MVMGLGNKGNKFSFGDNDLPDEASGTDGDSRDEGGDGFGSVVCSICLESVVKNGDRAWANLQCDHQFHLDCIGSAFNSKGVMQCPNCRKVEKGQWLYANGSRSYPEFNVEDWVHEEDIYELTPYSEMSVGVQLYPRFPTFEDAEYSSSSYHDFLGLQGYYAEPAAPTAGQPCPYVVFAPVHSSSSSSGGAASVSDNSSFSSHWNTGSSVSGEVPTHYGFSVDPHYHNIWEYNLPPHPQPQHLSASGAHVGSPTHPTPPPAAARTSRANGSDVIRPRPPHFMYPFHGHSFSGRAGSSVASVPRTPPFPGSNTRNQDRMQALQAYYQQSSAQSHQPDSPTVTRGPVFPSSRRPARGIASGMGSTSSSSDQSGGNGFIRFNIWERELYMQSQQGYSANQMDREPNIWTTSFNEGSGNFHQRHGGGGGSS